MASNFSCNSLTCQIDGKVDPVDAAGAPMQRKKHCPRCRKREEKCACGGRIARSRENKPSTTPDTVIVPTVTREPAPTPTPVIAREPAPPPAPLTVTVRQPAPETQIPQTRQPAPVPVPSTATIVPSKRIAPDTTTPLTTTPLVRETPKPFVPETPFVPLQLNLPTPPATQRPAYCNDPRFAGTELCAPDAPALSGYCADKLAALGSVEALSHEELCQTEAARFMHAAAPTSAASAAATAAAMAAKADGPAMLPAGAAYGADLASCLNAFGLLDPEGQAEVIEQTGAQKAISDQTAMDLRRGVPSAANAWLRFFVETYPASSPQADRFCALVTARVGVDAAGSVYVQSSRPYVAPRRAAPAGAIASMRYPNASFSPMAVPAGDDTELRRCFAALRSMPVSAVQSAVRANIRQMPTTTPLSTYLSEFVSANGVQRAEAARTAWVNAMSTAHWENRLSAPELSNAVRRAVIGLCSTFAVAPSAGPFSVGAMQKIDPYASTMMGANFSRAAGAPIPSGWTQCGMRESDLQRSGAVLAAAHPLAVSRAYVALGGQDTAPFALIGPLRDLAAGFLANPSAVSRDAFLSAAYGYVWSSRLSNPPVSRSLALALTRLAQSVERGAGLATNPSGYVGADTDVDSCLVQLSAAPPRALGEAIRRTQRILPGFGADNMTRSALTALYGSDGSGMRDQYVAWLRSSTPDVILTLCQQTAAVVGGIAPAGAPASAALFLSDADAERAFAALPVADQAYILRGTAFRGLAYPAALADALSQGATEINGVTIPTLVSGFLSARIVPSDARRTLWRAAVTDAAYRNRFLSPAGVTAADAPRAPAPATPKPGTTTRTGTTTTTRPATGGTQGRPGTPATPDATQIPPGFTAAQWADIVHNHPDVAAQLVTALANQPSTFTQVATQLLAATNTVLTGIHQGETDALAQQNAQYAHQQALAQIALQRDQAQAQRAQQALDPTLPAPAPAPVQYVQAPPASTPPADDKGLSTGAMVGIGGGVLAVGVLGAVALSKRGGSGGHSRSKDNSRRRTKKGNLRHASR